MNNKGLTLEIPCAVLEGAKLPEKEMEDEFRKELALAASRTAEGYCLPKCKSLCFPV